MIENIIVNYQYLNLVDNIWIEIFVIFHDRNSKIVGKWY